MDRLQAEFQRLYLPPAIQGGGTTAMARAALLELGGPADWGAISKLWRGVQADLELPAPAIAVSGGDAYQLWFSLAEPVPEAELLAFLEALQARYLGDIAPERLRLLPVTDASLLPRQVREGVWSAFVAPDLAPVFAETPWLDTPPSADGQANLLQRQQSIGAADFRAALTRFVEAEMTGPVGTACVAPASPANPPEAPKAPAPGPDAGITPRQFLLRVMNDETVALALRIEAAKALLPGFDNPSR